MFNFTAPALPSEAPTHAQVSAIYRRFQALDDAFFALWHLQRADDRIMGTARGIITRTNTSPAKRTEWQDKKDAARARQKARSADLLFRAQVRDAALHYWQQALALRGAADEAAEATRRTSIYG